MRDSTMELIQAAYKILDEYNPMTLRQVHYQLVANYKDIYENTPQAYKRLSGALVKARQEGIIPWEWLEDHLRKPRVIDMWESLEGFAEDAQRWYHRNIWPMQSEFVIVWVEKDALSGLFWENMGAYGVPLIVGRGYNSWSIRKEAADLIEDHELDDRPATVLYFGDFDPSGEDIVRDLRDGFTEHFEISPEVIKVALTLEQIRQYNLPPDFAKIKDARAAKFIAKYGERSAVELDALPPDVLGKMIRASVEAHLDMTAIREMQRQTKREREQFMALFKREEEEE